MSRSHFLAFLGLCSALVVPSMVSAQSAAKPKLSATAIQIAMVEAGEIQIPAEFRFAVYERLVEQVRASGAFQKVYRSGDRAADGIPDLVTLHTKVDVTASVTARDGRSLMDHKITGRVRFFGENLGVTNDLAKRISKLVRESF